MRLTTLLLSHAEVSSALFIVMSLLYRARDSERERVAANERERAVVAAEQVPAVAVS